LGLATPLAWGYGYALRRVMSSEQTHDEHLTKDHKYTINELTHCEHTINELILRTVEKTFPHRSEMITKI